METGISDYSFDDDLNWYAVMEGADPNYDTFGVIYSHIPTPEHLPLYQFGAYMPLVEASPVLVKLDRPEQWLKDWRAVFPGLAGSLVGSDQDLASVGSHLRTLLSVRVEGGADSLFRFHDSWIMKALYETLDKPMRSRLHGPIHKWLWLADDGLALGERPDDYSPDSEPREDGWLQLDEVKQDAIHKGLAAKRTWKEAQQ